MPLRSRPTARAQALPRSARYLVAANLVPLAGVLFLGWDLAIVMALFWAENVVIGVYAALRMALVTRRLALFLVPFFVSHYGMFTLVHGVFVFGLFVAWPGGGADLREAGRVALVALPGLLALLASHGASFVTNFLRGGEMRRMRDAVGSLTFRKTGPNTWSADSADPLGHARGFRDLADLMMAPYRRVFVMHLLSLIHI